jgi:lysozyme
MINNIYEQLERDEKKVRVIYQDSLGNPTFGVGHLGSTPLTDRAIRTILEDDVQAKQAELHVNLPWLSSLSSQRQGVFLNLVFNMGIGGLLGFHKMLAAAKAGNWALAATELLNSKYATQVGDRAHRLATQLQTDQWV